MKTIDIELLLGFIKSNYQHTHLFEDTSEDIIKKVAYNIAMDRLRNFVKEYTETGINQEYEKHLRSLK